MKDDLGVFIKSGYRDTHEFRLAEVTVGKRSNLVRPIGDEEPVTLDRGLELTTSDYHNVYKKENELKKKAETDSVWEFQIKNYFYLINKNKLPSGAGLLLLVGGFFWIKRFIKNSSVHKNNLVHFGSFKKE